MKKFNLWFEHWREKQNEILFIMLVIWSTLIFALVVLVMLLISWHGYPQAYKCKLIEEKRGQVTSQGKRSKHGLRKKAREKWGEKKSRQRSNKSK